MCIFENQFVITVYLHDRVENKCMQTTIYFDINDGTVKYKRTQFPIVPAYAVTAHKSQGDTLDKVAIDFSSDENQKSYISFGSFYVALTRVKISNDAFLKDFHRKYIMSNKIVAEYLNEMRRSRPYICQKIYNDDVVERILKSSR